MYFFFFKFFKRQYEFLSNVAAVIDIEIPNSWKCPWCVFNNYSKHLNPKTNVPTRPLFNSTGFEKSCYQNNKNFEPKSYSSSSESSLSHSDSLSSPTHSQKLAYRIKNLTECFIKNIVKENKDEERRHTSDAITVESLTFVEKEIILKEFCEEII